MELLTVLLFVLVPFGWVATGILVGLAFRRPYITPLIERAIAALVCSVIVSVYVVVAVNTDRDFHWFPFEVAVLILRLAMLTLAVSPVIWLLLYFAGRLDDQ